MGNIVKEVTKCVLKIGQDDPRRVIHSMKVGLAVTLVSLFYYFQSIYQDLGTTALWAVLTVVVVFEFSVGATFYKGLNRTIATLIGGALAVGLHSLATQSGHIGEPFLISIFVFLQGYGNAYFKMKENCTANEIQVSRLRSYKSVFNTKGNEETLINFAKWEPTHGCFRFKHPWKLYLQLGALSRECAYKIDARLNANIKTSPNSQHEFSATCNRMTLEASKTLKEQAIALKTMTRPSRCKVYVAKSKQEMKSLHELLKSTTLWEDYELQLLHVISATTIISILTDIVICTEKIANCTSELASLAHFKTTKLEKTQPESKSIDQELGKPVFITSDERQERNPSDVKVVNCSHTAITIEAGD